MNECIIVKKANKVTGEIEISGAKNSAVAILPALILSNGIITIDSLPNILDIKTLIYILNKLNVKCNKLSKNRWEFDTRNIKYDDLLFDEVEELRASYYFMGSMISRFKKFRISQPGGCYLGPRPINLHIEGFAKLGIEVQNEQNHYFAESGEISINDNIYLDIASVGATINIMLAACSNNGTIQIENAATEPEIIDVALFLNSLGYKITGAGTEIIKVVGSKPNPKNIIHQIIPDRIEAGSYLIIGAALGENLRIKNVIPYHLESLISKLKLIGAEIIIDGDNFTVNRAPNINAIDITTHTFPGFPTDLQQPVSSLLLLSNGQSKINDTIYKSRFKHLEEFIKMGANVEYDNNGMASINGVEKLYGTKVRATDLRAGIALIIAGLFAEGETKIFEIQHILRGYEDIIEKLTNIGIDIKLIS